MLSVVPLVLNKSSGSGSIIFPTLQSEGKGSLCGPLAFWYSLVASAHVGGKLFCLQKAVNMWGLQALDYFRGKIILGLRQTKMQRTIKRRKEKLARAQLALALLWINFKLSLASWVQDYRLMLCNHQPDCTASPHVSHALTRMVQAPEASTLRSKWEQQVGMQACWEAMTELLGQCLFNSR